MNETLKNDESNRNNISNRNDSSKGKISKRRNNGRKQSNGGGGRGLDPGRGHTFHSNSEGRGGRGDSAEEGTGQNRRASTNYNATDNPNENRKGNDKFNPKGQRSRSSRQRQHTKRNNSSQPRETFSSSLQQTNGSDCSAINSNDRRSRNGGRFKNRSQSKKILYPPHTPLTDCLELYAASTNTNTKKRVIRGKIRVMPGGNMAFVSCDRGSISRDVCIDDGEIGRNRAMDGDEVFVELLGFVEDKKGDGKVKKTEDDNGDDTRVGTGPGSGTLADYIGSLQVEEEHDQKSEQNDINADTKGQSKQIVKYGTREVVEMGSQDIDIAVDEEIYTADFEDVQFVDYDDVNFEDYDIDIGGQMINHDDDDIYDMSHNEGGATYSNHNGSDSDDANGLDGDDDDNYYDPEFGKENGENGQTWRDDDIQRSLWDPIVNIRKNENTNDENISSRQQEAQYRGRVIHVITPKKEQASEINPNQNLEKLSMPRRTIVGTLMKLPGENSNRHLLVPNSRSLPRFMTPPSTKSIYSVTSSSSNNHAKLSRTKGGKCNKKMNKKEDEYFEEAEDNSTVQLYRAEYLHNSWSDTAKWPPCVNLRPMGRTCNVEDETMALLLENGVDHGEFSPGVLRDVEDTVREGRLKPSPSDIAAASNTNDDDADKNVDLGWKPTPEMYKGRRDYTKHRIFTIDPTTAKDLDDALHITPLPCGKRVEIGVHIADVSHFVQTGTDVDWEAARRATTVYLVDRTVPMLPRPLCEIACSLNENVERLAFSCVWTMNLDGTVEDKEKNKRKRGGKKKKRWDGDEEEEGIWYGRTVIKSCARLDYATAQNIIDGKVANGEEAGEVEEKYWPKSRQPIGDHTINEVAADVRLMHKVAMARRKLRFQNGALGLNGVKLTFQLEDDGLTPALCEPYPIRDSNRLIEEYMLMANYFVAQRLITHAGGLALLRQHPPPMKLGLESVVDIAKESAGFTIDSKTSQTLQESLSRMGRECSDPLVMQCVTEMLMTPMKPAEYIAAGEFEEAEWHHFALNIPYYTHFTSPIRRYPDIIVHRLLQATIDGKDAVKGFPQSQADIQSISVHCNEKRMCSKKAQERSDRVFLSLYLKANPIKSALGVVLSVGQKAFTVFVPSLGVTTMVYLDDHREYFDIILHEDGEKRRMVMKPKNGTHNDASWSRLDIKIFAKISVSCHCKENPPIDVSLRVVGPWEGN